MSDDVENTQTVETAGTVDVEPVNPLPTDEPEFGTRPWHGASNPMEALYQWAQDELLKLWSHPALKEPPVSTEPPATMTYTAPSAYVSENKDG